MTASAKNKKKKKTNSDASKTKSRKGEAAKGARSERGAKTMKGAAEAGQASSAAEFELLGTPFQWGEVAESIKPLPWNKSFRRIFGTEYRALQSAVPDGPFGEWIDEAAKWADRSVGKKSRLVKCQRQLAEAAIGAGDLDPANAALVRSAATYGLADLIRTGHAELAQRLFQVLARESTLPLDSLAEDPLPFLLSAVETPLALSVALDSVERSHGVGKCAVESFGVFLEQCFDAGGWLHHRYLGELGLLMAAICRIRYLIQISTYDLSEERREHCEWIALQFARMMTLDGQLMLSACQLNDSERLLAAMRDLTEDESEDHLYRQILKGTAGRRKRKIQVESGDFGEEAMSGSLRCDWKPGSPRLAVTAGEEGIQLEINAAVPLIQGFATPKVEIDGRPLELLERPCEMNCWHSDEDIQYLELEYPLKGDGVWQRQFALCRPDELLIVADAFLFPEPPRQIDYRCRLPLADGISLQSETETREGYLKLGDRFEALLLPFTMGEWVADHTQDSVRLDQGAIAIEQHTQGRAAWFAWALDLRASRACEPRTWRRIHVAEGLRNVRADVAVAYRIQIGKKQWIVYRNLTHVGNRTFIGKNVHSDFFVGRFKPSGDIEQIIEIE